MSRTPQFVWRLSATVLTMVAAIGVSRLSTFAFSTITAPPAYQAVPVSPALSADFVKKGYKLDVQSGNYLHPRLSARTFHEPLAPLQIDGRYVKDVRGQYIYLRQTLRDKLELADLAMFKHKHEHLKIVYGFRPNYVQAD